MAIAIASTAAFAQQFEVASIKPNRSTRLLTSLLYDVEASDPPIFVAVALVLAAAATGACWASALKAALVDPIAALRHD